MAAARGGVLAIPPDCRDQSQCRSCARQARREWKSPYNQSSAAAYLAAEPLDIRLGDRNLAAEAGVRPHIVKMAASSGIRMKLLFDPGLFGRGQIVELRRPYGFRFHNECFAVWVELVSHGQPAPVENVVDSFGQYIAGAWLSGSAVAVLVAKSRRR